MIQHVMMIDGIDVVFSDKELYDQVLDWIHEAKQDPGFVVTGAWIKEIVQTIQEEDNA